MKYEALLLSLHYHTYTLLLEDARFLPFGFATAGQNARPLASHR